jgi:hypothetical protein
MLDFDWRSCWRSAVVLVALIGTALCARAEEDELSKMRQKFVANAEQFQLTGGENGTKKFDLIKQPVLSWSNPERRTPAGAMFFWTLDGRPQAAMCMYPTGEQSFDLEFQSLSIFPLRATTDDGNSWDPAVAGIQFQKLVGASTPAASVPVRLRQMRNLAREFSAQLVPPNRTPIPLRLMSAPIYRNRKPDPASEVMDGAVFSFVQGTDPEVLLLIEAIASQSGDASWRYGLARMSMVPLKVLRQNTLVWEEANWASTRQSRSSYYVIPKYAVVKKPIDPFE